MRITSLPAPIGLQILPAIIGETLDMKEVNPILKKW